MELGYILLYVEDVKKSVDFYTKAFGLSLGFMHESGAYAEMQTGSTRLGFVSLDIALSNHLPFETVSLSKTAPGIEVGFVTDSVERDYTRAIEAGAVAVVAPVKKPWGQCVSYVRDCNGFLVEICSKMQ